MFIPLDVNRIEKPVRKIRKLLKKMSVVPTPKEVHDLRTNARRIEAMLPALSLDKQGNSRRILKRLSRLRKRAGKVRDMDVLTGYISGLRNHDDEEQCSVQLLEHLGAEREKYAKKLYTESQRYAQELRKRLKRSKAQLEKVLPQKGKENFGGNGASADAGASALKALAELAQPVRLDRTNLHPCRLKVKEVRNLLQMAEKPNQREFVQSLGEVKDAIGEWHDWEELVTIAKENRITPTVSWCVN